MFEKTQYTSIRFPWQSSQSWVYRYMNFLTNKQEFVELLITNHELFYPTH